ncbi:MAG: bifunctional glutamate--cysteine ligase GshA/glutathione synthetase GshB, partial [Clostridiaceae bacterium]|nr:bifunctional glutamate--cysteine ligase GshA/glutathione synthetase GshB [Clostridiaceae bacterium]
MLNKLKKMFNGQELLKGSYGIERESVRIDTEGNLSKTPHPKTFGCRLDNPYITTDFAENQIEMVTPALSSIEETYNFLNTLYDIVAMDIKDELLWPQSMPPVINDEKEIHVASFCECTGGLSMRRYREYLFDKYGGKKQLISGIHYNFSYNEDLIIKLFEEEKSEISYKEFKNNLYLKVARNFLRYRWLITYLMGATPIVHDSFLDSNDIEQKDTILSYRNSKDGYSNGIELYPCYDSVYEYINSVNKFIEDKCIDSFKELYSQVRLKPKNKEKFKESLEEDGILYLEFRNIDVNPFDKCGISLSDMEFMQVFTLFLLIKDESSYSNWQQEADYNQNVIALSGLNNIILLNDGVEVDKEKWALEILEELNHINKTLNLGREEALNSAKSRIEDVKLTYAYRFKKLIENKSYLEANINLSRSYKDDSYKNRFKLRGFEDLELS